MRKTAVHTNFYTALRSFVYSKHISVAVVGKLNHIRSLMSAYGCL